MAKGSSKVNHHSALIYTMVLVSASDADMTDAELHTISESVRYLPAFKGFDIQRLPAIAAECTGLLADADGLDTAMIIIREALSPKLYETAYALACEIVAVDGHASQEELRMLELIRTELNLDRLIVAAIERGVRARFTTA
jgi:tellurite resistance protein